MSDGLDWEQLAALVGATISTPREGWQCERVSSPAGADAHSLVFAEDEASLAAAVGSAAGAILTTASLAASAPSEADRLLPVADPRYAFALAAKALCEGMRDGAHAGVHLSAVVHPTAVLGQRVSIGPGAIVGQGAKLGDDVQLGCRVVVEAGVDLHDRVMVQAGAVLGSLGFGYVRNRQTGEYLLFPQQGALVIEADVEIGANTTIDRGALGETRIGRGTKIDNLVHIGHNCRIGKNVIIAAQVGISGSCLVEDGAVLAGQVGISDHCRIGPGVILGGQAGVYRGKTVEGPGEIFAGTPAEPLRDHMRSIAAIRGLRRNGKPGRRG